MPTGRIELPQEGGVRGTEPLHFINVTGRCQRLQQDSGLTSWLWVLRVRKRCPRSHSEVGVELQANPQGTTWTYVNASARPTETAKEGSLPVPDVETVPNPGFREEGPSPLLCSVGGKKEVIKVPWS